MTLYDSCGTHHVIKCILPTKILPRVIITYGACARVEEEEGLVSRLENSKAWVDGWAAENPLVYV